jgi:hypothetical protein
MTTMIHGQDWASYQSATPSTSGLAFTFIKATEGTGYVSPRMVSQAAHARAAGLTVGFYHYLKPGSMTAQAAYFVAKAASQDGDLLAADWEDPGVSCAQKDAFIREVKRLRPGHRVVLYCNTSYWKTRDTTSYAGDGLWIADPNHPAGTPGVAADWLFQQYSSAGGVDRNVANPTHFKTAADLRTWAVGTTPNTPPEDDMPTAADVWKADVIPAAAPPYNNDDYPTNKHWTSSYALGSAVLTGRKIEKKVDALAHQVSALAAPELTDAQLDALAAKVTPGLADAIATKVADILAARLTD